VDALLFGTTATTTVLLLVFTELFGPIGPSRFIDIIIRVIAIVSSLRSFSCCSRRLVALSSLQLFRRQNAQVIGDDLVGLSEQGAQLRGELFV
jgi:hypothetical protein